MNYPRFVLAGAYSGVGKTSVAVAIMGALKGLGVGVQPYKVGPDYIDPAFHTFVTGAHSRNLDSWLVEPGELRRLFVKTAPPAGEGVSIIEGVMGLYDGNGTTSDGSTAHVAETLRAPVVLVVNGEGIGRSLGALVRGYRDFDDKLDLAGIIVNRVSGEKHYRLLKSVVEGETGLACYGYMQKKSELVLDHRPLGLIPPAEIDDINRRVEALARMARETLDIARLLKLARTAPPLETDIKPIGGERAGAAVRIGVPRDTAFYAYYEDNLDLLRELGAEIVFFDSLGDSALPPELSGLYIGGGSPEVFAEALADNTALKESVRKALEGGLPAYAEGAGCVYLCRRLIRADGVSYPLTGFLDCDAIVTTRLPNFGHVTITLRQDTPLGGSGTVYRANEYHRLRLEPVVENGETPAAYDVCKTNGLTWSGGFVKGGAFASLAQCHFYANKELAVAFIESCARYKLSG